MNFSAMMRHPSAFLPVAMSLIALAVVIGNVAIFGVVHEADEGTAAHVFQLLLLVQLPIVFFFALRWVPTSPVAGMKVLGVQALAGLAALAPVFYYRL